MSNRRKDRPLPSGYLRYDGDYDKVWYDIITFNGVRYGFCWPNAGMFHTLNGRYISGNDVFAVKKSVGTPFDTA